MPRINLLPWREALRAERQKQFIQLCLLVVLIAGLLITAASQWVSYQTSQQQQRNQLIERRMTLLDEQLQEVKALRQRREQMLTWISVVRELQQNRGNSVQLFNQIVHAISDGLYLTRIEKQDNRLTLEGEASGNRQISELMRNLSQSTELQEPTLNDVSASSRTPGFSRFVLELRLPADTRTPTAEASR